MKAKHIQGYISRSSQQVLGHDYLPLLGIGETASGVQCPVLDSVQARHQRIGESQLDDEACDVCPKDKDEQSKVAMEEIPMTKMFPHTHNEDY